MWVLLEGGSPPGIHAFTRFLALYTESISVQVWQFEPNYVRVRRSAPHSINITETVVHIVEQPWSEVARCRNRFNNLSRSCFFLPFTAKNDLCLNRHNHAGINVNKADRGGGVDKRLQKQSVASANLQHTHKRRSILALLIKSRLAAFWTYSVTVFHWAPCGTSSEKINSPHCSTSHSWPSNRQRSKTALLTRQIGVWALKTLLKLSPYIYIYILQTTAGL